jgi:hypothetical protein
MPLVSGGPTGKGYKYNTNPNDPGLLKGVIESYGLDYFDQGVLDPLRKGPQAFGGVDVRDLNHLNEILSRPESDPERQAVLGGINNGYVNWIVDNIRDVGTERDPNIQEIRRQFSLPGSSVLAEEGAAYEYRVRPAFGG